MEPANIAILTEVIRAAKNRADALNIEGATWLVNLWETEPTKKLMLNLIAIAENAAVNNSLGELVRWFPIFTQAYYVRWKKAQAAIDAFGERPRYDTQYEEASAYRDTCWRDLQDSLKIADQVPVVVAVKDLLSAKAN